MSELDSLPDSYQQAAADVALTHFCAAAQQLYRTCWPSVLHGPLRLHDQAAGMQVQ